MTIHLIIKLGAAVDRKAQAKKAKKTGIMRKLKSLLAVAVAATIALPASAITESEQGETHAHGLTPARTQELLEQYCGIFNSSGTWAFTTSKVIITETVVATKDRNKVSYSRSYDYKYDNEPTDTDVKAGDAIFIKVNNYWKGNNWSGGTSNYHSLYNQAMYGIEDIEKVTQKSDIASGLLYFHNASTNRFFFAVRTSSIHLKKYDQDAGSWSSTLPKPTPTTTPPQSELPTTQGESKTFTYTHEQTFDPITMTESQRTVLVRWYNEYSAVP